MCCYPEIYIKCEKKILELLQNQQFEECLENIHIRFKNEENLELDFESIEEIKKKTTQNFTEFLKELYLYQVDHPDVVFPTTIVYPNNSFKKSILLKLKLSMSDTTENQTQLKSFD